MCVAYTAQAKSLFKKMSVNSHALSHAPSRMSYESGPMIFHYIVEHGVCYLTVTDRYLSHAYTHMSTGTITYF